MSIQPLKHYLKDTMVQIKKYQTGELRQIKTNREWLDREGGLTPRSILTIVGASFSGKSTELENLKADIFDQIAHPITVEYGSVEEWEPGPGATIRADVDAKVEQFRPDS